MKLLTIAHDLGYTWNSTALYCSNFRWNTFKENSCYNINNGTYGDCESYQYIKKIINVSDLFVSNRKPFKLYRK
jgi:Tfp pilus tip-associated adhesin PilY1